MALPVLDGNQTATTLSSVVTGGEHIVAHSVVSLGANAIANITSAVSGSVVSVSNFPASQSTTFGAVTGSISVLNFPSTQTVAGTVTANGFSFNDSTYNPIPLAPIDEAVSGGKAVVAKVLDVTGNELNWSSGNVPISGTVTVGNSVTIGSLPAISGTVTANVIGLNYDDGLSPVQLPIRDDFDGIPFVVVGPSSSPEAFPISGTVTANNPNGALTTRFGSVTTANTAQITSAVTNTSRKYLLAQNISAGTVTIGIGFSPTTTQGIQLTAGGGLTFDAFCPTGAVYWLGAVTGAAFTILEG